MAYDDVCERCGFPTDRPGQFLCRSCRREAVVEHALAGKKSVPQPVRTLTDLTGERQGPTTKGT